MYIKLSPGQKEGAGQKPGGARESGLKVDAEGEQNRCTNISGLSSMLVEEDGVLLSDKVSCLHGLGEGQS